MGLLAAIMVASDWIYLLAEAVAAVCFCGAVSRCCRASLRRSAGERRGCAEKRTFSQARPHRARQLPALLPAPRVGRSHDAQGFSCVLCARRYECEPLARSSRNQPPDRPRTSLHEMHRAENQQSGRPLQRECCRHRLGKRLRIAQMGCGNFEWHRSSMHPLRYV